MPSSSTGTTITKPFLWTATVDSIQEKHSRCRRNLEVIQPGCNDSQVQQTKGKNCLVISQALHWP
jgi:hypothetical protein